MESWWPLSAWLSPGATMFLFFNVLVGAVAVMSRGQQGGRGRRLCRSASSMVLDRLRSFSSMFAVVQHAAEWEWYDYRTTPEAGGIRVDEAARPELQDVLEPVAAEPPRAPVVAAAAGALESMRSEEKFSILDERNVQGHHAPAEAEPSPPTASAVGGDATDVVEGAGKEQSLAKEAPAESSKRHARACPREAEDALEGKAELNERAELFIHQFKEDLKLQRLNSIINYTRALRRGAGAALSQE